MITPLITFGQNQIFFSENWSQDGGEIPLFYKNASATDDIGNVYMTGSTLNSNNNHDIIIQKFTPDGGLLWQKTFNGAANMDDMAADIFVDHLYNVFITGTSVKTLANDNDLVVLKYKSNGDFQWYSYYDNAGSPTPKDYGTAITGDNNGNIYVTGTSFGQSSLADYVTLRIDANNGNQLWESRYDYMDLLDVPAKIELHGTQLYVSGGSQMTPNKWELATVIYNISNGNQIGERRSQGSAIAGVNEVHDLTVDNAGNVYVTGAVVNQNTGYDISIYKLDPQLNILWEVQFDGYGADDQGKGIKVDNQGNVYVAGYVSNPNEGRNYSLLKYNVSGVFQWSREFNGEANLDDEAVQLIIRSNQDVFVTGSSITQVNPGFMTIGYKPNGELFTQAKFGGENGLLAKPTGITNDLAGNIIVIGRVEASNGNTKNITVKYNLIEKPFNPVMIAGEPSHNANEVIIRFDKSAVNYAAIDRKGFIAGKLSDFVKPNVIASLNSKLKIETGRLRTFKIFTSLSTADSLSITRLGDTIRIDDFWATLSVFLPQNLVVEVAADSINKLKKIIKYSHLNHMGEFNSSVNDPIYAQAYPYGQSGLFYSEYGINIEPAWDIQAGYDLVKVGVFDTGINWKHEDFGDGTSTGSVIKGGLDFVISPSGTDIFSQSTSSPDPGGHGTALAGIIAAKRNNGKGISGIAGGDIDSLGLNGVSLYSFRHTLFTTDVCNAITKAIIEPINGNGYGINIINLSFSTQNSQTLRNVFKSVYEHSVIVSAASGEYNTSDKYYPASFNDDWVMKVGASDTSGARVHYSSFGNELDFLAPGTRDIYATLDNDNNSGYSYQDDGTSYAAPHVAGVAALMYSEHHPVRDSYYPNVLAPEDVEEILQRTATPVEKDISFSPNPGSLPVPNEYAGYGRINAGGAVEKISAPYMVHHLDRSVNTNIATFYDSTQTINYPEGVEGITNAGYDIGNTYIYKLTSTFPIISYDPNTFLDVWVRNSSGDLYGLTNTIYKEQWGGAVIDTVINNQITMTGYLYKVEIVDAGIVTGYKWLPTDNFSTIKFTYSHYKNLGSLSTDKEFNKKDDVNLYPNPTNDEINFSLNLTSGSLYVEIYDVTGKRIKNIEYNDINGNQYHNSIDVSKFSKGLYFCKFDTGVKQFTKKFIKN